MFDSEYSVQTETRSLATLVSPSWLTFSFFPSCSLNNVVMTENRPKITLQRRIFRFLTNQYLSNRSNRQLFVDVLGPVLVSRVPPTFQHGGAALARMPVNLLIKRRDGQGIWDSGFHFHIVKIRCAIAWRKKKKPANNTKSSQIR